MSFVGRANSDMSNAELNPYTSPNAGTESIQSPTVGAPKRFRWRLIAAALTGGIGLLSTAFGIFAVGVMAYVVFVQRSTDHLAAMLAGCFLYLGFGVAWITAGVVFWKGGLRIAIFATIIGVLIPIVLFTINGF